MSDGKNQDELTQLAEAALRAQPGCETARVPTVAALPDAQIGRNWEIPNVVLGDSLISDVDRAVLSVHRQLGRKFHLV
ncbi:MULTISPECIES: hypothetical protein [unclassified Bradyrhizobium]|uniref:hypothetical protein n=1 Tax=unclassified Bradyrhizobium TaxID=2631580 RepID=UPI0003F8F88E|nr:MULTISPECIES: hypothetical protein [unclassified Bradyrhizobium]QIG93687.1 hypothetical protein G6P99_15065 [Bradyrhizobium sp. 6(2017)]